MRDPILRIDIGQISESNIENTNYSSSDLTLSLQQRQPTPASILEEKLR